MNGELRDDDLGGLLRDHFATEAGGVDAVEDWDDLTGRIRARGRRRTQLVSSAAAVMVVVGIGCGFAWGHAAVGTSSNDTATAAGPTPVASDLAPSPPAPQVVNPTSESAGSGALAPEMATPKALSSGSQDSAASRSAYSTAGRSTATGVTLHTWTCGDGTVTVDAASSDTVGRVVVRTDAASIGGPVLAAVASIDGVGRPHQLVTVGVYAPGATRLRATFPDGSIDIAEVTGPVTALASAGVAQAGGLVQIESLLGASNSVIASTTVGIVAGSVTGSVDSGC